MEEERNEVVIKAGKATINGFLDIPKKASGIVIFAHGSGSSRFSPRNNFVARTLRQGGLGTLLMDLLTRQEEMVDEVTRELRFDIDFLASRLNDVTDWLQANPETKNYPMGYFGSSTGAAAALVGAAKKGKVIKAVVSRGGRPDLAEPVLDQVVSPTLLIVGGNDFGVIELNEKAFSLLKAEKKLEIVEGATHLFEESGTLEEVSRLARDWFIKYFKKT